MENQLTNLKSEKKILIMKFLKNSKTIKKAIAISQEQKKLKEEIIQISKKIDELEKDMR